MLTILLIAQIAAPAAPQATDSTYSSSALRDMVAAAAQANHAPPAALQSYTSRIETETSLLVRDTLGREQSAEIEQVAAAGRWARNEHYDLHVVGYRSQSAGVPYSTLSMIRSWTVPTLYGERLSLGVGYIYENDGTHPIIAVHPFAADRDKFYHFSGGDTVTTLHAGARTIPIARIRVHPAFDGPTELAAFDGEIDLDAQRHQIVRMRGRIVTLGGQPSLREKITIRSLGFSAAAYVEFVNAEIDGAYWLPAYQRTEFQVQFALFGQDRPVFRVVSTIHDIMVNDTTPFTSATSMRPGTFTTWAPSDSVDAFKEWMRELGAQSGGVHADDFIDLAPDDWKLTGAPKFDFFPHSLSRMFRFNRVEGLYLGLAPSVDFRSAVPGLSAGMFGGWAFSEKTARGGAYVSENHDQGIYGARVERALVSTNDFVPPLSDDPGFGALFGSIDNYDYVDRSSALLSATRILGTVDDGLLTAQAGAGRDEPEHTRVSHSPFGRKPFLPNRGALAGDYGIGILDLEIHPAVGTEFVTPGLGVHAHYEIAHGDLSWQRSEVDFFARKYIGRVTVGMQASGGIVAGSEIPPQQLFELGGADDLPGYSYKQFAGDRAALFQTQLSYRFPAFTRPLRMSSFFLPGLSPGIATSIQGGWTQISSAAAVSAVNGLGAVNGAPVSTATNGIRATVGAGVTLFGDLLHVGIARPIDRPAPWRFVAGLGATF